MSFKIAFIGAGSIGFTRTLLCDLLSVPEFQVMYKKRESGRRILNQSLKC